MPGGSSYFPEMETLHTGELGYSSKFIPIGNKPNMQSTPISRSQRSSRATTPISREADFSVIKGDNHTILQQNKVLRERLHLVKANSSLRAANVLAEIVSWIDTSCAQKCCESNDFYTTDKQPAFQNTPRRSPTPGLRNNSQGNSPVKSLFNESTSYPETQPKSYHTATESAAKEKVTLMSKIGRSTPQSSFNDSHNAKSSQAQQESLVTPKQLLSDISYGINRPVSPKITRNDKTVDSTKNDANDVQPDPPIKFGKRRGSVVYELTNPLVNVQLSEGFKSTLNDASTGSNKTGVSSYAKQSYKPAHESDEDDNSISDKDEQMDRKHGYIWEKKASPFQPVTPSYPGKISTPEKFRNGDQSKFSHNSRMDPQGTVIKPDTQLPKPQSPYQSQTGSPIDSLYSTNEQDNSTFNPGNSTRASHQNRPGYGSVTPISRNTRSPEIPFSPLIKENFGSSLKIKPTVRLIGEICFQLDRKILNYVFKASPEHKRRRFYGYIIQNIDQKIEKECIDAKTGMVDERKRYILQYRYQYILNSLKPLGYEVSSHPDFCADMVNKYGLLPLPPDRSTTDGIKPNQKDLVMDTLVRITPREEVHDVQVILDCLTLMAKDDNSAIISF